MLRFTVSDMFCEAAHRELDAPVCITSWLTNSTYNLSAVLVQHSSLFDVLREVSLFELLVLVYLASCTRMRLHNCDEQNDFESLLQTRNRARKLSSRDQAADMF